MSKLRSRTPAPAPTALAAQALHAEHERHASRLAALRRMDAKLRHFEAYMPAIRAAGINVHPDDLNDWGRKVLWVSQALASPQRNATLEAVLRAQGMREIGLTHHGDGSYRVDLSKGHLTVSLCVNAHRLPKKLEVIL